MHPVKRRTYVTCPDLRREVAVDVLCVPLAGGTLRMQRIVACSAGKDCARQDPTSDCPAFGHEPLGLPPGARFIPVM